jgi:hypothetical protein
MDDSTFRDRAQKILRKKSFHKKRMDRSRIKQIRVNFVEYVQNGHFKNVLDLIIEYHNLLLDSNDTSFVIEELLKQDGVSIFTSLNQKDKEIKYIQFEKVFGLTIQFVQYPNLEKHYFCHILRNGSSIKNDATDINRDFLDNLVADYLEENS